MAEQESNVCVICGGTKTIVLKCEPTYTNGYTSSLQWTGNNTRPYCSCPPPEPAQKHDGRLDERGDAVVSYGKAYFGQSKDIHIDGYDDGACLTPAQALSLLDWLLQEKETLERLAKEQERG